MSTTSVPGVRPRTTGAYVSGIDRLHETSSRFTFAMLVILACTIVGFPLYWMVISSFKPAAEFYGPPLLIPKDWTLKNYSDLLSLTNFGTYFINSMIVAVSSTILALVIGGLSAYATSRFNYRMVSIFSKAMLFAYILPQVLIVIPLYVYVVQLGLADTLLSIIVSTTAFTLPFTIWYMRAYFNAIPVVLEESAMVDGCTRFQAFRRVVLPLAMPGLISTGVFAFDHAWNEFLFALVFTSSERNKVLTLGLATWIGEDNLYSWGMLLAGAVLITLPVMIFYFIVQGRLVVGLTAGATKGE
jgi:ABC-type glycerol-3-phosphate transport system permease component